MRLITKTEIHICLPLREKMAQAYDFALDKIGMEIMSYQVINWTWLESYQCAHICYYCPLIDTISPSCQIWVDYINFLKGVWVFSFSLHIMKSNLPLW